MAASVAMDTAGISSPPSAAGSTEGMEGAGRECGSAPIRGMSSASSSAATVVSSTAIRLAGRALLSLGSRYITAATPATTASVCSTVGMVACDALSTAARRVLWPGVPSVPVAKGTCWRKMMAAMPSVKPSTTGQGMNATARPSPLTPRIMTSSPAITETRAMLPTPWTATTGARTTTMAPVGPETWTLDPPMTAATSPATTAVMSPASAPTPELTPKARARGSATMPTVMPANRSVFQADRKSS